MMIDYTNKVFQGHCPEILSTFPDNIVNCCVTSPPYYGLRDYGTDPVYFPEVRYRIFNFMPEIVVPEMTCNLGLEDSPEAFVGHIVYIFRQVYRVLKNDGTLWLNFGDSYWGSGKGSGHDEFTKNLGRNTLDYGGQIKNNSTHKHTSIKPKDLIGIPWMIAFALRSDGWYLRQDIIWHKPNPMPESVTDRCTKSHEYIFLLSKSKNYYFDSEAIKEKNNTHGGACIGKQKIDVGNSMAQSRILNSDIAGISIKKWEFANKRSVWTVTTKPFKDAHFATFPEDLIVDCIKAGCPEGGIVLDPFGGSMTTAATAKKLNRNYISIELNHKYVAIGEKRFHNEFGIFK